MNRIKAIKHHKLAGLLFSLALVFPGGAALNAQSLDAGRLENVKNYIAQIRHPDQVDMLPRVQALAPTSTHRYLIALADDTSLSNAIRLRATGLLVHFSNTAEVRTYLENTAGDEAKSETRRNLALATYVRAFYEKDPGGVETFVRQCKSSNSKVVAATAKRIVGKIAKGARHPAGDKQKVRGNRRR